ncbi:MAG: riboflavin biosynthesis protein RibF [Clostridia bacterium]|nr:riboflavin biosynthesis protein RibF [Clostridia bacterium]
MEIFRIPTDRPPARPRVIALGFFDGMHIGHAALLAAARREGDRLGCETAVFSFSEDSSFKPHAPRLLSEEERLSLMEEQGIDAVFLYDFAAIRDLSPAHFAEEILVRDLSAAAVCCGYNFRFGACAAGDPDCLRTLLAAHRIPLVILQAQCVAGETVSASAIRRALAAGDAEGAARMLGRPYTVRGCVAHGKELGRRIGAPTANLPISRGMVVPAHGVYAALGYLEGEEQPHPGVANIGVRPTVDEDGTPNCETHFLDDVGDIYGRPLAVSLLHRLRGEIRFETIDALRAQIARDASNAKEYIQQWQNGQS